MLLLLLLSHFSRVWPHRWQPTRLHRPWDSPGKNIGVGCHFLLQCIKVKSESEVTELCPTPSNPMDCSLPGSSVHGIFQARVLEWVAIAFSVKSLYTRLNTGKHSYGVFEDRCSFSLPWLDCHIWYNFQNCTLYWKVNHIVNLPSFRQLEDPQKILKIWGFVFALVLFGEQNHQKWSIYKTDMINDKYMINQIVFD